MFKASVKLFVLLILFKCALRVDGKVLVDQLIGDYLKAEQDLWRVIEKREPSTLQQIYDLHTHFLKRDYGQSHTFLNAIYLSRSALIINSILSINQTSHSIAREFFEHRNYTVLSSVAMNGIDLDNTLNVIYDETVNSTEFWDGIHNVSYSFYYYLYSSHVYICSE